MALQRLVDELNRKHALLVIAEHDVAEGEMIDVAAAIVVEYRSNGRWRRPPYQVTVRTAIEHFKQYAESDPLQELNQ